MLTSPFSVHNFRTSVPANQFALLHIRCGCCATLELLLLVFVVVLRKALCYNKVICLNSSFNLNNWLGAIIAKKSNSYWITKSLSIFFVMSFCFFLLLDMYVDIIYIYDMLNWNLDRVHLLKSMHSISLQSHFNCYLF